MRAMFCECCGDRVPSSEATMVLTEEFNMFCKEVIGDGSTLIGSQVPLCPECNEEYQTMLWETVSG